MRLFRLLPCGSSDGACLAGRACLMMISILIIIITFFIGCLRERGCL